MKTYTMILFLAFLFFASGSTMAQSYQAGSDLPEHTFTITAPKEASVFVGEKDQRVEIAGSYLLKHYVPFTEKAPVHSVSNETSTTYYYNVSKQHNYRVSQEGKLTHVGMFTPSASAASLQITAEQLDLHSPKAIDHDVNSLNGRNVADIFLNINAAGYLTLPLTADTTFQLINLRNWQAIDTDVNNYFIEPDYHYTVLNENGTEDNTIVTVSPTGLITPLREGTVIVQIRYDAMMCAHTKNVGNNGAAFFSALWPENTGTFVLSVGAPETDIKSNMFIGEYWNNEGNDKVDSVYIDAEHDVLYYETEAGGFDYTFTPENVAAVALAQPIVGENKISYNGFSAEGVTHHANGSYTVRLVHGRNIVRLTSSSGVSEYQVVTAKPVTYTISNLTRPNDIFEAGDSVSIVFNTLYHPAGKLSGIYNMSAGIQYTGELVNFPLISGPGQYMFASRAQEYKIRIPAGYQGDEYILTNGVIKTTGFGSIYGSHRNISVQNGVLPNLNAGVRLAYLGSLPDIRLNIGTSASLPSTRLGATVYPNPFTDYIMVNLSSAQELSIYSLSGQCVYSWQLPSGEHRIDTTELPHGVYIVKAGGRSERIIK